MGLLSLCLILIGVGYLIGHYLTFYALSALTFIIVVFGIYLWAIRREIEALVSMVYTMGAFVMIASMWVTFYMMTNQTFVQEFIHQHVIR